MINFQHTFIILIVKKEQLFLIMMFIENTAAALQTLPDKNYYVTGSYVTYVTGYSDRIPNDIDIVTTNPNVMTIHILDNLQKMLPGNYVVIPREIDGGKMLNGIYFTINGIIDEHAILIAEIVGVSEPEFQKNIAKCINYEGINVMSVDHIINGYINMMNDRSTIQKTMIANKAMMCLRQIKNYCIPPFAKRVINALDKNKEVKQCAKSAITTIDVQTDISPIVSSINTQTDYQNDTGRDFAENKILIDQILKYKTLIEQQKGEIATLVQYNKMHKDDIEASGLKAEKDENTIRELRRQIRELKKSATAKINAKNSKDKERDDESDEIIKSLTIRCTEIETVKQKEIDDLKKDLALKTNQFSELIYQAYAINEGIICMIQSCYHVWECGWLDGLNETLGKLSKSFKHAIDNHVEGETICISSVLTKAELDILQTSSTKAYDDCDKVKHAFASLAEDLITHKSALTVHIGELEKKFPKKNINIAMNQFVFNLVRCSMDQREVNSKVMKILSSSNTMYKDIIRRYVTIFDDMRRVLEHSPVLEGEPDLEPIMVKRRLLVFENLFNSTIKLVDTIDVHAKTVEEHVMNIHKDQSFKGGEIVQMPCIGTIQTIGSESIERKMCECLESPIDPEYALVFDKVKVLEQVIAEQLVKIDTLHEKHDAYHDKLVQMNHMNTMLMQKIRDLKKGSVTHQ